MEKPAPDRIHAREEPGSRRLVDHDGRHSADGVLIGNAAAAQERHAHRLKVVGAHDAGADRGLLRWSASLETEAASESARLAYREAGDRAGRQHTGMLPNPLQQSAEESRTRSFDL